MEILAIANAYIGSRPVTDITVETFRALSATKNLGSKQQVEQGLCI